MGGRGRRQTERERGAALQLERLALVMGEDEHGVVERRIVTPPGVGIRVRFPRSLAAAEHAPAHYRCRRLADEFGCQLRVDALVAALPAVFRAPSLRGDHPLVKLLAALAERVLEGRIRARDEAVEGH